MNPSRLPRGILVPLLALLAALPAGGAAPGGGGEPGILSPPSRRSAPLPGAPLVAVLCYHDVADVPGAPPSTIPPDVFRAQVRSFKEAGWTFLTVSGLLARRDSPGGLPPRVVVLTFDDAYRSFSGTVLPILKEEGVPATLAVAESLLDRPPPDLAPLMSWDDVRAADRSGIVEIASHTGALHRYVTSNPWRDTGPAVTTRRYLLEEGRYEDRDEYRRRIRGDLRAARRRLSRELGHAVRVLSWPYGEHTAVARDVAAEEGFAATLGLDGTDVRPDDLRSGTLPRVMVFRGMRIGGRDLGWLYPRRKPVRAAQVDLDAVYDPDVAAFRRNVDRLVERVRAIGATHAFLQACPDPDGDGRFRAAWFMNHQVPVKADIWSMVAAKLSHAGVAVWIRAPVMNLAWAWEEHPEWRIPNAPGGPGPEPWYFRLSPDLPGVREAARDFYTDLAVYLPVEGVLFDDDAYMLPGESLRGNGASSPEAKAAAVRELVEAAKAAVLAWRPEARFARNLYAPAADGDGVNARFSQDPSQFLRDYDLTVAMAYARMEGRREDAGAWTASLYRALARRWVPPRGQESWPPPVMLKFQAYDWAARAWVPGGELSGQVRAAREAMAVDLGVYPVIAGEGDLPDALLGPPPPIGPSERYPEPKAPPAAPESSPRPPGA